MLRPSGAAVLFWFPFEIPLLSLSACSQCNIARKRQSESCARCWKIPCPAYAATLSVSSCVTEKKGKAPVRAPCPEWLGCFVFRLSGLPVGGAEFPDLGIDEIGELRNEKHVVRVKVGSGLPLAGVVLVAALQADAV